MSCWPRQGTSISLDDIGSLRLKLW